MLIKLKPFKQESAQQGEGPKWLDKTYNPPPPELEKA